MNHHLKEKKILIAITGGIAAYKMNAVVRGFIKKGAEVKVILTPNAKHFVSPLTLSTLSQNEVLSAFASDNQAWNSHVELGLWADVMLISPCTANTLAKMTHGVCDNLVIASYMSAKCPVFIAPAMDMDMYAHPSTQKNLALAKEFGHHIIPAEKGELASGLSGEGRLAEPCRIIQEIENYFGLSQSLLGKTYLITAGPTFEEIDPVRFIGNYSSGKMGFALAKEARKRGARVILVSGPTQQSVDESQIEIHRVTSAKEMRDEVFKHYKHVDVAIMSAAVADYTPREVSERKIKKTENHLSIELVQTPDILKEMGECKTRQFLVGFALETHNETENARAKLEKKKLDAIILNSLQDQGAGFQKDTNKVTIITQDKEEHYDLKAKEEVAKDVLDFIENKN